VGKSTTLRAPKPTERRGFDVLGQQPLYRRILPYREHLAADPYSRSARIGPDTVDPPLIARWRIIIAMAALGAADMASVGTACSTAEVITATTEPPGPTEAPVPEYATSCHPKFE
jgi:hypothetical protein